MKQLILAIACCLLAAPAWAVVSYDTDTGDENAGGDATTSFSHTIGAGSNTYVGVCVLGRGSGTLDVTDVTIGGGAATFRVGVSSASLRIEYWDRAMGSTTGSITITATVNENIAFRTVAMSFFGVNQTTPSTDHGSASPGAGTSITDDVTSAVGDMAVSCVAVASVGDQNLVAGGGQTPQWDFLDVTQQANTQGSTEPGAATVTMSHTWDTSSTARMVDANIQAAASSRRGVLPIYLQ